MLSPEEYQSLLELESHDEEIARLDRFAAAALIGVLSSDDFDARVTKAEVIAGRAWHLARAMMKIGKAQ